MDGKKWAFIEENGDAFCLSKWEGVMDFQDIEMFNMALLAKQGWCIMQNTD